MILIPTLTPVTWDLVEREKKRRKATSLTRRLCYHSTATNPQGIAATSSSTIEVVKHIFRSGIVGGRVK
eukprot:scaffold6456_cov98-Skeletonema_dohrnii-CCMP3373.AAC.7